MPPKNQMPSTCARTLSGDLADSELASWLETCLSSSHRVAYIHSGFLCKVVDLDDRELLLHSADPQGGAKSCLKRLVTRGLLYQLELPFQTLSDALIFDSQWSSTQVASKSAVDSLISEREGLLGRTSGRGPKIDEKTAQKVWAEAGGRCMFAGCGQDLSEIPLWTGSARVAYLAHIVASDPQGPRGSQEDSHRLANEPENIMLMCDSHHRLIDSFAPIDYPANALNVMRCTHRDRVRIYLDSLKLPSASAVTLHADLAHIPTYFHESDLINAILATGRAMAPGVTHYVRRKGYLDDRSAPGFWNQYLREHEGDIRQMVTGQSSAKGVAAESIAVFPLHHVPTMVLGGRIMGEARDTQVFQYDRERRTWSWNQEATPKSPGFFGVNDLPKGRTQEVLITIELTATVDEDAVPAALREKITRGDLSWVRITAQTAGFDNIAHMSDLDQFAQIARRTINHVQDVARAEIVHLITVSPASTVFRFGQMLQAGHHSQYIIYDRAGRDSPFVPAFSITGQQVSALDDEQPFSISLR